MKSNNQTSLSRETEFQNKRIPDQVGSEDENKLRQ